MKHGTKWVIDHIIPVSLWDDKQTAMHYTNCQPLSPEENFKKGNKI